MPFLLVLLLLSYTLILLVTAFLFELYLKVMRVD